MNRKYLFMYPPTISYQDWITQRPQMLLKAFVDKGYNSILFNFQPDKLGTHYIAKTKYVGRSRINLWAVNSLHDGLRDPLLIKEIRDSVRVLWVSHPPTMSISKYLTPHITVFDLIDEPSDEFARWSEGMDDAIQASHLIVVTSDQLYELAVKKYPNKKVIVVKNGADSHHFDWKRTDLKVPQIVGKAIQDKRPVIGFHGSLQSWVNYDIISGVAKARPNYAFVIVGPDYYNAASKLASIPNVLLVGPVKFEFLHQYVNSFDVGIIPFEVRQMTNGANPIKMYEYYAAGVPIVATPIRECIGREPYVLTATTVDGFASAIDKQIQNKKDIEFREQMRSYAMKESWHNRVDEIISALDEISF